MKNFTLILLFISLFFGTYSICAQEKSTNPNFLRTCGTDEYNAQLLSTNPKMMGSEAYENLMASKIAAIRAELEANPNRALQFTIPVVVHVIHNGEPIGIGANISDAQVISQIQVMNEDFRRLAGTRGFNTNAVGADVEVEFCLAKQTPDGCITNGIDRVDMSSVSTSWSTANINAVLKPATIWNASQYMNMWSVNFSDATLLGYAQFPGGPAITDGVVANYTYFGSNDATGVTIPGSYNLGRTMTHEVGHYLGLYHTFEGGCTGNGDFCNDTPKVASPNFGCSTGHESCGSVDMVENYMDYSDDACMNVFTVDQKARVIATMMNAANRPNTVTSNVCVELSPVANDVSVTINSLGAVTACSANNTPNVRIQNYGTSTLTSATLTYNIDSEGSATFDWTGALSNGEFADIDMPAVVAPSDGIHTYNISASNPNGNSDQRSCNDEDSAEFEGIPSYSSTTEINLNIMLDNYGSETSWTFSDETGVLFSGGPYTNSTNPTPINEVFKVIPNKCYSFTILDSYGDGMCCSYGNGSYTLRTDDDTIIRTGGTFSSSETTQISTIVLGIDDNFSNANISLFPNPTSNQLTIKLGQPNDLPTSYEIFNVLGQTISKKAIFINSDLLIDTSAFSNGMYFIKISKENTSVVKSFIKK